MFWAACLQRTVTIIQLRMSPVGDSPRTTAQCPHLARRGHGDAQGGPASFLAWGTCPRTCMKVGQHSVVWELMGSVCADVLCAVK